MYVKNWGKSKFLFWIQLKAGGQGVAFECTEYLGKTMSCLHHRDFLSAGDMHILPMQIVKNMKFLLACVGKAGLWFPIPIHCRYPTAPLRQNFLKLGCVTVCEFFHLSLTRLTHIYLPELALNLCLCQMMTANLRCCPEIKIKGCMHAAELRV